MMGLWRQRRRRGLPVFGPYGGVARGALGVAGTGAAYAGKRFFGKRGRSAYGRGVGRTKRARRYGSVPSRGRRSGFRSARKGLKPRVKKLEKFVANQQSTKTERTYHSEKLISGVNLQGMASFDSSTTSTIATTVSTLRMFNPSAPATLITVDLDVGTYSQSILAKWAHSMELVNNYSTNVDIWVYSSFVKADTSINAFTAIGNGLADNPDPGTLASTTYGVLPGDSEQFKDLYSHKLVKRKRLVPGQSCYVAASSPYFEYDPATVDSHTSTYQRKFHGHAFVLVVRGTIGHDTVEALEVGAMAAGVDVIRKRTTTIKYDAGGVDLHSIAISTSSFSTPTTGFVQAMKPINDLQAFAVL